MYSLEGARGVNGEGQGGGPFGEDFRWMSESLFLVKFEHPSAGVTPMSTSSIAVG